MASEKMVAILSSLLSGPGSYLISTSHLKLLLASAGIPHCALLKNAGLSVAIALHSVRLVLRAQLHTSWLVM